jgi:hypothetical protein
MRCWLMLVFVFASLSAPRAAERCYTSEVDLSATITDDGTDNGPTLVMMEGGKTIVMSTMGAGTGIQFRVAKEDGGETHAYRYFGNTLVMDMVAYERGCPGDHSWIDRECSRVLISQGDPSFQWSTFYFLEPGQPITNCSLPAPFEMGAIVNLQCASGHTLQMDAREYPRLTVDGIEMLIYDGPLPCPGRGDESP